MFQRRKTWPVLISSIIIVGLLTACAQSLLQPPAATSSAASTPKPSASQAADPAPAATVAAIVVRPEAIELHDASGGLVQALDYRSDVPEAIATLTEVFDEAPVATEYPGSSHEAPSIAHRWGGFELWEVLYVNQWEGLGDLAL